MLPPALAVVAMACGGALAPLPPSPRPGAAPVPAPEPAAALFRYASGERSAVVESRATIRVANDSGAVQDTLVTTTWLRYRIGDGTAARPLEVTVDSVRRAAGERVPAGGGGVLPRPVHFQGTIAAERVELRLDSAATANCASPAAALQPVARELLPSIPARLARGARWEESVTSSSCRGGALLTILSRHQYQVPADGDLGGGRFRVLRTTEVRVSGSGEVGGEPVRASGEGRGTGELLIDRVAGAMLESTTRSRLEITFSALGRDQRIVQDLEQRVRATGAIP